MISPVFSLSARAPRSAAGFSLLEVLVALMIFALSAIVLETDAPDIPPEWKVGARNTPDQLPRIAQELAGLRDIALEEVAEATTRNATSVLPGLTRIH